MNPLGEPIITPKGRKIKPGVPIDSTTGEEVIVDNSDRATTNENENESKDTPHSDFEPFDASGDGKVIKCTVEAGDKAYTPTHPSDTATVTIHLEGRYHSSDSDGKDVSIVFEPMHEVSFVLGNGDVVEGLELAVYQMRKDERATILVKSEYAYGKEGSDPDGDFIAKADVRARPVPPNCHVEYDVKLVSYTPVPNFGDLSAKKKYNVLLNDKNIGISLYRLGKYRMASKKFDKVNQAYSFIDVASKDDPYVKEATELKIACLLNRALVLLKLKMWSAAAALCDEVLEFDEEEFNTKALLRRGKAYVMLCEYELASSDFEMVIKHDKTAAIEAQKEIEVMRMKIEKEKEKEKKMYRGIFGELSNASKASPKSKSKSKGVQSATATANEAVIGENMPQMVDGGLYGDMAIEDTSFWGKTKGKLRKIITTVVVAFIFSILAILVGNLTKGRPILNGLHLH